MLGVPLNGVEATAEGRLVFRGFCEVVDVPTGFQDVTFTVDISSPGAPQDIPRLQDGQRPLFSPGLPRAACFGSRRVAAERANARGLTPGPSSEWRPVCTSEAIPDTPV